VATLSSTAAINHLVPIDSLRAHRHGLGQEFQTAGDLVQRLLVIVRRVIGEGLECTSTETFLSVALSDRLEARPEAHDLAPGLPLSAVNGRSARGQANHQDCPEPPFHNFAGMTAQEQRGSPIGLEIAYEEDQTARRHANGCEGQSTSNYRPAEYRRA